MYKFQFKVFRCLLCKLISVEISFANTDIPTRVEVKFESRIRFSIPRSTDIISIYILFKSMHYDVFRKTWIFVQLCRISDRIGFQQTNKQCQTHKLIIPIIA